MNDRAPGEADPLALETVERIWRERGSPGLVLFGSRAKGRYREDSDIDVMVPVQGRASERDQAIMSAEMSALAGDIYGRPIHVSAMCMHLGTFLKMRRSVNHIAAIVAREGVALTDNPELFSYDPEDLSMEPLVTRRMRREALRTVAMAGEMLMEHEPDLSVEWAAGRAMHGALSAVISGNLREIGRDRTLEELERRVREMQPEARLDTRIPMRVYARYDGSQNVHEPGAGECIHTFDRPTRTVRADVAKVMSNVPDLRAHPWPTRKRRGVVRGPAPEPEPARQEEK